MNFVSFLNEIRFSVWEMMFCVLISCALFYSYFALCFSAVTKKNNVTPESGISPADPNKKNPQLIDELECLKCTVDEKIRAEHIYANPHLNIERMAQMLDLPVRQLSFLIKTAFHQNYFEFINHYRLMAAKERLASKEWAASSVQDIYESVGFSSRSTFFTLFKKREGITPAEYRSKHRANPDLD